MNTKLKVAFIASIILNVLLIGVLFGTLRPGFSVENSRRARFSAEVDKLPEPARSRLRDQIAQFRSGNSDLREQLRQARNEAIRLLVVEPFDEAAYERQLTSMNDLRGQMTKRISDDMKDLMKDLPQEQRIAIGEILKRPPPPPPPPA